jgi:hypothetical protein
MRSAIGAILVLVAMYGLYEGIEYSGWVLFVALLLVLS